jgi:hypothetical protein
MKLPLSELLDRWSIENRKAFFGHGNQVMLDALTAEIRLWVHEHMELSVSDLATIMFSAMRIAGANHDIANLEWQLRAKDPKITAEEHGRRAIAIRHINDNGRTATKAQLSKDLGENVETRQYGYGDLIQAEQITKDVQPISTVDYLKERWDLENTKPRPPI